MINIKRRIVEDEEESSIKSDNRIDLLLNPFNYIPDQGEEVNFLMYEKQAQIFENVKNIQLVILKKKITELIQIFKTKEPELWKNVIKVLGLSSYDYCTKIYQKLEKDQRLQTIKIIARQKNSEMNQNQTNKKYNNDKDQDEMINDEIKKIYIIDSQSDDQIGNSQIMTTSQNPQTILKKEVQNNIEMKENLKSNKLNDCKKISRQTTKTRYFYMTDLEYLNISSTQKISLIEDLLKKNKLKCENIPKSLQIDQNFHNNILKAKTQQILSHLQKEFLKNNFSQEFNENQLRGSLYVPLSKILFGNYQDIFNFDEFDKYLFGYLFLKGMLDDKLEHIQFSLDDPIDEFWKQAVNDIGLDYQQIQVSTFIKAIRDKYVKIERIDDTSSTEKLFEEINQKGEYVLLIE